ncbi:MAG: hypothetical protein V7644_156 [Actinomycetota bacterium]
MSSGQRARRLAAFAIPVGVMAGTLAAAGAASAAYPWPVPPFSAQHPVRADLDDPRITMGSLDSHDPRNHSAFHSGIDISTPDGSGVYSVSSGVTLVARADAVNVVDGGVTFTYWHVHPAVPAGVFVREHQLLGTVTRGWGHVHFAERDGGVYVNPLRAGALTPYVDGTTPVIRDALVYQSGKLRSIQSGPLRGVVSLVADAYDTPPLAPPPPWDATVLPPAYVSWRLDDARGNGVLPQRLVADLRWRLLWDPLGAVFAPGTFENDAHYPGIYHFWLARHWDTRRLRNGDYELWITAGDIRGNELSESFTFTIANA